MFNFYEINKNDEIWIRDRLIIEAPILYKRVNSIQKLKLLDEI
jgi:hypothetical protein